DYILKIIALYREFMLGIVVVCGCECLKFGWENRLLVFSLPKLLVILKLHVRYGICRLFRYASDFIWLLGKNDFDSLEPAGCFRYRQARIAAITYCSQRKPFNFGNKSGSSY
ncbi:MAG: hypothetical protein LBG80_04790, partial [Bacteroidales bacterium]|nr:hypothetical protein [Bacteroidales bacterium]